jgi:phage terminase large subunit-like protein
MTATARVDSLTAARLERLRYLRELQLQQQREQDAADGLIVRPWKEIARPEQLAPPGDWFCWLILAGRGWGKSRTAAEWAAEKGRQYPGSRIALVGKTFADVRDTMYEGESGLIACFSAHEFLNGSEDDGYNRSRLEVRLSNGSRFKAFSAEKPWRLRGPQHHFCFPAGTMIQVPNGSTEIEKISVGDLIMTRSGPRAVTWTGSRLASLVTVTHDRGTLTATNDHPVMTQRGWVPLVNLRSSDMLISWVSEDCFWRSPTSSTSDGIKMTGVTGGGARAQMWIHEIAGSTTGIARSGSVQTAQSQRDTSFIMRITFPVTTGWKTYGYSHQVSTSDITAVSNALPSALNAMMSSPSHAWGRTASDALSVNVHGERQVEHSSPGRVSNAEVSSQHEQRQWAGNSSDSAVFHARMWHEASSGAMSGGRVSSLSTSALNAKSTSPVVRTVSSAVRAAPIGRGIGRVYSVQVAGEAEYFADDVLVHNCWADESAFWQDAHKGIIADTTWSNLVITLRLPKRPQWDEDYQPQVVVATTPRPVALLRTSDPDPSRVGLMQRPTTVITRGRTVDNLENLSKTYQENVVAPLLGTRLGRQELDAEILDDVPGALWQREWIEETRITDPALVPDLIRVVVGVDPAVTDGESSAQTGIIVAGAAKNGRGYVLGDFTLRATPMEAMKKVIAVYHEFKADRIVAEVNNGGDYIGTLIKTVDPNVPFQAVRATRGKAIRAEPVSSLYEQRRISHVGSFPYLEDSMCSWTPMDGESPDRLDACVWAVTALRDLIGGSFLSAYGVVRCASCQHAFVLKDPMTKQPRLTCPKCSAPVILGDD